MTSKAQQAGEVDLVETSSVLSLLLLIVLPASSSMWSTRFLFAAITARAFLVSAGPVVRRQDTAESVISVISASATVSAAENTSESSNVSNSTTPTPTVLTVLLPVNDPTFTPPAGFEQITPYVPYEGSAYTQGGDNTTILAFYQYTEPVTVTQVVSGQPTTLTTTPSVFVAGKSWHRVWTKANLRNADKNVIAATRILIDQHIVGLSGEDSEDDGELHYFGKINADVDLSSRHRLRRERDGRRMLHSARNSARRNDNHNSVPGLHPKSHPGRHVALPVISRKRGE